jgi:predicted adenine nucleotide alpha hydrolase (AANH) superfamily ATPase
MTKKSVLLHICCAPCATVPIKRLMLDCSVSGFFYNPNIYPQSEYIFRKKEFEEYLNELGIPSYSGIYDNDAWEEAVKSFQNEPEGGARCVICYRFRLRETARMAKRLGINFFSTTLTLSPHKNADAINKIGIEIESESGVQFLAKNFKKGDGFKESCEMSKEMNMYRQNYCGCRYSLRQIR